VSNPPIRRGKENSDEREFRSQTLRLSPGGLLFVGRGVGNHGRRFQFSSDGRHDPTYEKHDPAQPGLGKTERLTAPRPHSKPFSIPMDTFLMIVEASGPSDPSGTPAQKLHGMNEFTPSIPGPPVPDQNHGPAELAGQPILLVEDNDDARNAFLSRLVKIGLKVATAHNGQEACELALAAVGQGQPFAWILMDMQMPVVDGFEATRRLRSQGYDRPIIAMTAYAMEQDRRECLQFGCDNHITKPIDWNELTVILAAHLR
jgi:CheY-like chemotaxis protein